MADKNNCPMVKLQHKVPRKYLEAWCGTDGRLFTLRRGGNLFSCSVTKVDAQKYFYQFEFLSIDELEFLFRLLTDWLGFPLEYVQQRITLMMGSVILNRIISGACPDRSEFELYVEQASRMGAISASFANIARMAWVSKNAGVEINADEALKVDAFVKNGGEKILCKIEEDAWSALDLAVGGQVCRINENSELKWHHAKYMVYQTMRGDKFIALAKNGFRGFPPSGFTERVASYMRYFMAEKLMDSLHQKMSEVNFRLIENTTDEEFLTSDNPIFDPLLSPGHTSSLNKWAFFFPVSPRRALLLIGNEAESKYARFLNPSIDEVVELNCRLCDSCVSQIHATHSAILEKNVYRQRLT